MPSLPSTKRRSWEPKPTPRPPYQAHAVRTSEYDTSLWRRMRKALLAREPLCRECVKEGKLTSATIADHIRPVRDGADFFDASNHQPLCASHHARKSAKEGHQRRKGG